MRLATRKPRPEKRYGVKSEYAHGTYFLHCGLGDSIINGARALFADGSVRNVRTVQQPDTYFSISASAVVRGVYVTGYCTTQEVNGENTVTFRMHTKYETDHPTLIWKS